MNLLLNPLEFVHIPQRSVYNDNLYKHKEHGYEITEKCDELSNCYSYYLEEAMQTIYLGGSEKSLSGNEIIDMEFKAQHT